MLRLEVFTDVPVVPVTAVHQHVALGGPLWPEFAAQTWVRHCRGGVPQDQVPVWPGAGERLVGAAVWGGFLDSHFGHFVADHLPRLPAVLRERPGDTYLFTVDPGMTRESLPGWVAPVLGWIGLPMAQVRLVTAPLTVDHLWVGSQAESLPQVGPVPGYLEILAGLARGLEPGVAPLLYVGRAGMAAQGAGVHAGESYVIGLLGARGVALLDPARAPLCDQLAAYAGAGRIVFAEGSALHGRQVLGHVAQEIAVLRRRPGKRMAEAQLVPRCHGVTYHDVGDQVLMAYWKSGAKRPNPALSLYDVRRLHRVFAGFGVDLATGWDGAAYRAAAMADVEGWLAWHKPKDKHLPGYAAALTRAGLMTLG
jgi:hypothetical protein